MREIQCFHLKTMSKATLHFFKTFFANFAKYKPNYVPFALIKKYRS